MRTLVAIANYGTSHEAYCVQLIEAYQASGRDLGAVDIVVFSDTAKDYGSDVEVVVGLPESNPWSLPFGHRKLFYERRMSHDLYIYTEDDVLIGAGNVRVFLEATAVLPEDRIAGFLIFETDDCGRKYLVNAHGGYHWEPKSIETHGGHSFAYFTNEHSACYMLTAHQLHLAIASGGFVVPPHESSYDMLCSAANDPYTQCGLKKLICTSRIDDSLVCHLPNVYLRGQGRSTLLPMLSLSDLKLQIEEMTVAEEQGRDLQELGVRCSSKWQFLHKQYQSAANTRGLEWIPQRHRRILSVGVGLGLTEAEFAVKGRVVWAVPLDDLMAVLIRKHNVHTTASDFSASLRQLAGQQFDVVLLAEILEYWPAPVSLLAAYQQFLAPTGQVVIRVANHAYAGFVYRRIPGQI